MDAQQMVLEKVPHTIQIRYSFAPYPGAELKTIELTLPEGALLLDAIHHLRIENNVPVYLEHSMLSTAQSLIQSTHKTRMEQEVKIVNQSTFTQDTEDTTPMTTEDNESGSEEACAAETALQKAMIENYRSHTSQFYTQPEENMFPEAYHTLVHSPIPHLFDAILDLEREYAGEVDALLSARDAEISEIRARHNAALSGDVPQRSLALLSTKHVEVMEVVQATWNSQLDDLQSIQRSKYQEFVLELYSICKKRQLKASQSPNPNTADTNSQSGVDNPMDGKDMVAEAMRNIGERKSNVEGVPTRKSQTDTKPLPPPPKEPSQDAPESTEAKGAPETQLQHAIPEEQTAPTQLSNPEPSLTPPPKPPRKEDPELDGMIKSILEMGFDMDQARGALTITNRNMDHAINLLLEQPDSIPRLLKAKEKVDAMKENARQKNRTQSSPQQPHPSLVANRPAPSEQSPSRPLDRSSSVSSPRPVIPGLASGASRDKAWSPLPFLQQQKNALLTNNANPSVKKFGGWLNKAMENLGLDDEQDNGPSRTQAAPVSNLTESFTVVLGSSHSKVTHNLRLMVSDPAEIFPSNRVKSERDAAIQAQTASSLYGQNLTGLVQLVNIQDWAKYKAGQVCHQEFFQSCQTSTELHFDSIEKQLEALEEDIPLDGSTLNEGDFVITRHSNLPMIHVVFHLFYSPSTFSQQSDFPPKPNFLSGLRSIIRTAHRYEITMLSIPFLMLPPYFENQIMAASQIQPSSSSSSRHSGIYGSPSSANISGSYSAASSPSVSSLSSFASSPSTTQHSTMSHPPQPLTDQMRKDLQKRAETLLRHLKSYMMENARQVKQVGNQGSEAEKFRASQGGDVKVLQFMLPKGTSDEMFRSFRVMLVNIFGGQ
ncbi:MAG: hypothetical protein BYD32DRAFT_466849 [Podila humilis]|nr:MAG: hypothetical protein BYD32DRAFT_466849 [Podila humilis]